MDRNWIRRSVRRGEWHLSSHAEEERLDEEIEITEIEQVFLEGEILETYPNDPRGPSVLMLGYGRGGKHIHAVVGKTSENQMRIITVYIPTPPKWLDPKKRGQKK